MAERRIMTRSLNDKMDYGLKEWDGLQLGGIMRWTMVWRDNEMDYGLKENDKWNYDKNRGDVDWCHDGTWN